MMIAPSWLCRRVYVTILYLAYYIYAVSFRIWIWIRIFLSSLPTPFATFTSNLLTSRNPPPPSTSNLETESKKILRQLPKHISLIIRPLTIKKQSSSSFIIAGKDIRAWTDELGHWVCWCWIVGIRDISFFDQLGLLKEHAEDLETAIMRAIDEMNVKKMGVKEHYQPTFKIYISGNLAPLQYDALNRAETTDIHINLISSKDGRSRIIEWTKNFMRNFSKSGTAIPSHDQVYQQLCETSMVSPPHIFSSDPSLLYVLPVAPNQQLTLDYYPAWESRLTEIYAADYGTLQEKDGLYKVFWDGLLKFNKIEMRFGK